MRSSFVKCHLCGRYEEKRRDLNLRLAEEPNATKQSSKKQPASLSLFVTTMDINSRNRRRTSRRINDQEKEFLPLGASVILFFSAMISEKGLKGFQVLLEWLEIFLPIYRTERTYICMCSMRREFNFAPWATGDDFLLFSKRGELITREYSFRTFGRKRERKREREDIFLLPSLQRARRRQSRTNAKPFYLLSLPILCMPHI